MKDLKEAAEYVRDTQGFTDTESRDGDMMRDPDTYFISNAKALAEAVLSGKLIPAVERTTVETLWKPK